MSSSAYRDQIDRVFDRFISPDTPGCAVSVCLDGEVIHASGYGSAHLEYGIPIEPSTVFHVASVSKQFTCYAIILLAQRGLLDLDDDIRQHVPEMHDFGHTITIRHLAHHTSGIRDQWTLLQMAGWRQDDVITKEHILKLLYRQQALNFVPGAEHLYCNSGYSLLAEIVERVTGQTFRSFLNAEVFDPLGMTSTHVHDDHQEVVPNRAYSYEHREDGRYENRVLSFSNHGATSLFTTVEDLTKWMQHFEKELSAGDPAFLQLIEKDPLNSGESNDYAFGVSVSEWRGTPRIQHSGSDAGFRSNLLMIPEHRFAVTVLSNVADSNPAGLAQEITEIILSDVLAPADPAAKPEPAEPAAVPEARLSDDCCGLYESPELDTRYQIVSEAGQAVARHQRHSDIVLRCPQKDRLVSDSSFFQSVEFTRNESGNVTGFLLSAGRVRNLRFNST